MQEKIIQFGPQKNMLGIVSVPDRLLTQQPAILLLNSGLIHHVGPYGMSVELARNLADSGFLVFRFDLPSIGDSGVNNSSVEYKDRTIKDIANAMDAITKQYNINTFVSIGICTGAMNSHIIACNDPRVKGAALLDGYSYPTLKYWLNRYKSKVIKIFNPLIIINKIKQAFQPSGINSEEYFKQGVDYWELPPKKEIANDLACLVKRNVKLLCVYTGGLLYYYNYKEQLRDNFKNINFKDLLEIQHLKKMDHTYTLQRDRIFLIKLITNWLESKFLIK